MPSKVDLFFGWWHTPLPQTRLQQPCHSRLNITPAIEETSLPKYRNKIISKPATVICIYDNSCHFKRECLQQSTLYPCRALDIKCVLNYSPLLLETFFTSGNIWLVTFEMPARTHVDKFYNFVQRLPHTDRNIWQATRRTVAPSVANVSNTKTVDVNKYLSKMQTTLVCIARII